MKKCIYLNLVFMIFLLVACGTGPALNEKTETDVSVNVATGQTSVDVNTGFTLEFNITANTTSVNSSTFFVVPTVTANVSMKSVAAKAAINTTTCNPANAITGTITPGASGSCVATYTLNPSSALEYETEYALCVTSGVSFCNPNVNGFFSGLMETFTTVAEGATYTVGGTISGLSGTVVLQNNAADDLTATEDGSFTFSTAIADGATYEVTVKTNPTGETCTVTNGSGTISGANVTNISITCSASEYTVTPSGTNVTIDPSDAQTVTYNNTTAFNVTADGGYKLSATVGGTCPAGSWSGADYTTGAITGNCTVTFSGTLIPAIYTYQYNLDGIGYKAGTIGDRTNSTSLCNDMYNGGGAIGTGLKDLIADVGCTEFLAMLPYGNTGAAYTDGVTAAEFIANYSLPETPPIKKLDGTELSDDYDTFLSNNAPAALYDVGSDDFPKGQIYGGFGNEGVFDNNGNCNNWTQSAWQESNGALPLFGAGAWNWNGGNCQAAYVFLCLCW